ncbi:MULTISPECIES: extracellular solute-binding protein [Alteromonas]|jgi:iron(III) transport system substrate-binding protein|uniref:ABC transporter substrate-binding protein n=1 Tax=Alteromonas stellipolaris TaxID=233316 RepID=A0AAW7Z5N6_9ALTE|nr:MULTISPECIES: extracellular solute-binding protein [Alteromonas]AMJ89143.1 ABC transporter substrate-binding protein [Alteromonas sp. Mac2]ALM92345.1 Ferric iron ABC transporter, iron-binding protein [Alteromonas stellipolaris LMG 21856]AMJ72863.1 ABC transporter substrate-binding protein [Alteromonas stellipolaris]AMJ85256.1 ABC transporter substrate-binding protein [Alteromonas sp. Mac1]AMJ92993.1 ABC transporter substrate-binding protein [Alteromonas stellipolaris]
MQRRTFLQGLAAAGALGSLPISSLSFANTIASVSVESLPKLEGDLTLYLGRGEGGLYENVLDAIKKRNPKLNLKIRRGASAALANTLAAEAKAGVKRADLFWAVDTGSIGMVTDSGLAKPLPTDLTTQLKDGFQYPSWTPVTGRIRTLPYNTERVTPDQIPDSVMALADSDLALGWAPAYASFQSFVTAMRILEGEKATADWLKGVNSKAKKYAGELGVVMGVERGEVDMGFANHYYTLRLKAGKPNANVALAYTQNDAGCLVNASGIVALSEGDLPVNFIRYLLSREVQGYLASEAYEIPLVQGVTPPQGLPALSEISPPDMDLRKLADLRPTLNLMRKVGVL